MGSLGAVSVKGRVGPTTLTRGGRSEKPQFEIPSLTEDALVVTEISAPGWWRNEVGHDLLRGVFALLRKLELLKPPLLRFQDEEQTARVVD